MKRALIVFNSFFGPGMARNRMLRILRHLPAHGYEPVLLTDVCRNEAMGRDLPARVVQVPFLDLQHAYARLRGRRETLPMATGGKQKPESRSIGLTTFINRWLLVPDKQILWAGPAVRAARELLAREKFDVIFASNLPATNGVTGARIASATGLPLVLEYRDLWTGNPYHNLTQPTALHRALHARMERAMLREASRVECLSTGIAEKLAEMYGPLLPEPPRVHYNFFDPDELAAAGPAPAKAEAFTISYVGTMYLSRNPAMFFQGLERFIRRNSISREQFRFRWLGFIVGIENLQEMIRASGVEPYMDFLGQIPHREALNELRRSHVSLIIQSPDDTIHIPGKMFEAMGARVPLLAVANPCEVTRIMDRTRSGIHCPYEVEAVADAIEKLWLHWKSGAEWNYADAEIAEFSVKNAVGKIAALLDEAVSAG